MRQYKTKAPETAGSQAKMPPKLSGLIAQVLKYVEQTEGESSKERGFTDAH